MPIGRVKKSAAVKNEYGENCAHAQPIEIVPANSRFHRWSFASRVQTQPAIAPNTSIDEEGSKKVRLANHRRHKGIGENDA
jgi:hypothetical protein